MEKQNKEKGSVFLNSLRIITYDSKKINLISHFIGLKPMSRVVSSIFSLD